MKKLQPRKIKQVREKGSNTGNTREKKGAYNAGSLERAGDITGPESTGRLSYSKEEFFKASYTKEELEGVKISPNLEINIGFLRELLGANTDFVQRFIEVEGSKKFAIFFIDGMVKELMLARDIISPLQKLANKKDANISVCSTRDALSSTNFEVIDNIHMAVDAILYGSVPVFIDGEDRGFSISVQEWQNRTPEEPINESVLRGPREGFVETLRVNTALLRRRLRSPNMVIEEITLGEATATGVALVYYKGVTSPDLVQEVKSRLKRIKIDGVMESNYIQELISDEATLFPTIMDTERPDKVIINILRGRVAILVDNTPFALIAPTRLTDYFQSADDLYLRWPFPLISRPVRYIAFFISLLLPSIYVALTTFHQEMIPLDLLVRIAASREGVPLPAALEAITMQIVFEILREAGVRLPKVVGSAVSIVGALIIGTAAVDAGLVSSLMVIVVALTGISSFLNPVFSFSIVSRMLVFPLILLAAAFGLFGVAVGLMLVLINAISLRSFGVPYLAPMAPYHRRGMEVIFTSAPIWALDDRPTEFVKTNVRQQKSNLKPDPRKS